MLRYQRVGIYYNLLRKFGLLNVMLPFEKLYFYDYLTEKISILPIIRENVQNSWKDFPDVNYSLLCNLEAWKTR